MNIHLNLNLNQMANMKFQDSRRNKEEISEEVSRSMLETETLSEEEDSSSYSLSSFCSSSDDDDDVSSSSSNGPLEDLSDLMSHLPIKRGLSKFYEGKSKSFTSLENVKNLEDLMKKKFQNRTYGERRKKSRSSGEILDQCYKSVHSPKAIISKKSTKAPSSLSKRKH